MTSRIARLSRSFSLNEVPVPREANVSRGTFDRRRQVTQPDGTYRPTRWSPEEIILLGRLWRAGANSGELARLFGTTPGNLRRMARRHGFRRWTEISVASAIAHPVPRWTDAQRDLICRLLEDAR